MSVPWLQQGKIAANGPHRRLSATHITNRAIVVIADRDVEKGKKLEKQLIGYVRHLKSNVPSTYLIEARDLSSAILPFGRTKCICFKKQLQYHRLGRFPLWSQMRESTERMKFFHIAATAKRLKNQIFPLSTSISSGRYILQSWHRITLFNRMDNSQLSHKKTPA